MICLVYLVFKRWFNHGLWEMMWGNTQSAQGSLRGQTKKMIWDWEAKLVVVGLKIKWLFLTMGIADHWNKEPGDLINSPLHTALKSRLAAPLQMNLKWPVVAPSSAHGDVVVRPGLNPSHTGKARQAQSNVFSVYHPIWGYKMSAKSSLFYSIRLHGFFLLLAHCSAAGGYFCICFSGQNWK